MRLWGSIFVITDWDSPSKFSSVFLEGFFINIIYFIKNSNEFFRIYFMLMEK